MVFHVFAMQKLFFFFCGGGCKNKIIIRMGIRKISIFSKLIFMEPIPLPFMFIKVKLMLRHTCADNLFPDGQGNTFFVVIVVVVLAVCLVFILDVENSVIVNTWNAIIIALKLTFK